VPGETKKKQKIKLKKMLGFAQITIFALISSRDCSKAIFKKKSNDHLSMVRIGPIIASPWLTFFYKKVL